MKAIVVQTPGRGCGHRSRHGCERGHGRQKHRHGAESPTLSADTSLRLRSRSRIPVNRGSAGGPRCSRSRTVGALGSRRNAGYEGVRPVDPTGNALDERLSRTIHTNRCIIMAYVGKPLRVRLRAKFWGRLRFPRVAPCITTPCASLRRHLIDVSRPRRPLDSPSRERPAFAVFSGDSPFHETSSDDERGAVREPSGSDVAQDPQHPLDLLGGVVDVRRNANAVFA